MSGIAKGKHRRKRITFFQGYLMTVGALTTMYLLARGVVWLLVLINPVK